jgi:hypothetical protein
MRTRLKKLLPAFKIPDAILDWPDDSSGARMKVDRQGLRAQARALFESREK